MYLKLQELKVRCLSHGMSDRANWNYWWQHYLKLNQFQIRLIEKAHTHDLRP